MNNLVLIIDDDPSFLDYLAVQLKIVGYTVETASTGDDGIRAFKRFKPDLVICDMVMPARRGDGLKAVSTIRSLSDRDGEYVKILMMSGGGVNKDCEGWLRIAKETVDIDDVIQKTSDRYDFIQKVSDLMARGVLPGKLIPELSMRVT